MRPRRRRLSVRERGSHFLTATARSHLVPRDDDEAAELVRHRHRKPRPWSRPPPPLSPPPRARIPRRPTRFARRAL